MRLFCKLIAIGMLAMVTGCLSSLHPLYTEADLVFDPALIGQWAEANSSETWTFSRSGEKGYKLMHIDSDGRKGAFLVHLVEVSGVRYLDFFPEAETLQANELYKTHIIPAHSFLRVEQIGPELRMLPLNVRWVENFLQRNPGALRHEKVNGGIILTARPKELQAFLAQHGTTAWAFDEAIILARRQ